ncbi:hypothetical protein J4E85_000238 [Alternaria conjuncta]|uniref:uncharacterized protein n=1 Tax=Alternaria conjuncta TaxID=181017 RepID=UPI00221E92A5|nr:uncharacterized protein J4E85_000238 [Alternaria conjuncta]KAI4937802.1 hypothetical protein J4E85_000238 [Alternaria conjuncta]
MTARVLLRRGWVLQERLLSPRSIYYGEKLHWECSELHACETFPHGGPITGTFNPWGKEGFPFRAANLLYDDMRYKELGIYAPQQCSPEVARIREVYRKWLCVVEYYSKCQLTYEEDRFPALMGLAKYWQVITEDDYVAGTWRRDLVYGLLWYQERPAPKKPRSKDYRDAMGRLSGAKLRVTAPIRRLKQPLDLSRDAYEPLYLHHLDDRAYGNGYSADRTVLLLLTYRVKPLFGTHEIKRLTGLILERVAGKKVFKRIGMFEHGWFQHRLSNGEWPLFIDWDPLREKKTTLTII